MSFPELHGYHWYYISLNDYYRSDVITTAELEAALATLKDMSGDAKIQHLVRVLDEDHDGNINLEELGEVSGHMKIFIFVRIFKRNMVIIKF